MQTYLLLVVGLSIQVGVFYAIGKLTGPSTITIEKHSNAHHHSR